MTPATEGRNFALWSFGGSYLMVLPLLEAHLAIFVVIQTHHSCLVHRAVKFLGLRRNGASAYIINQG